MSLAVEYRIKIYEPLITADEVCFFFPGFSYTGCSNVGCRSSSNRHALLFVNRKISQEYMAELLRSGRFTFVLEYGIRPGQYNDQELRSFPQLQPAEKLPQLVYQYARNITLHTSFGGKQETHVRRMLLRLQSMENLTMTGAYLDLSELLRFDETLAPVLRLLRTSKFTKSVYLLFNYKNRVWVRAKIEKNPISMAWAGNGEVKHKDEPWTISSQLWHETVQMVIKVLNGKDVESEGWGEM